MRGRSISQTPSDHTITRAVESHNWAAARFAITRRLGEAMDATDSARDLKSLARSIAPLISQCETDDIVSASQDAGTPLAQILAEAAAQEAEFMEQREDGDETEF